MWPRNPLYSLSLFNTLFIYLFICLCWVSVASCGIFLQWMDYLVVMWGLQNIQASVVAAHCFLAYKILAPRPGIEILSLASQGRFLMTGPQGKSTTLLLKISPRHNIDSMLLVAQSCLTLYSPMDCSLPGSSVYGVFQARMWKWVAILFSRDLPDPGIEQRSPALQANSLLSEPPGKPIN